MKADNRKNRRSAGLLAAVAAAVVLGAAGLAQTEATAAPKSIGVIKANVPDCAYGFKRTSKDKKGSYKCVSVPIRCPNPPATMLIGPKFNKATRRFEYSCVVPAG